MQGIVGSRIRQRHCQEGRLPRDVLCVRARAWRIPSRRSGWHDAASGGSQRAHGGVSKIPIRQSPLQALGLASVVEGQLFKTGAIHPRHPLSSVDSSSKPEQRNVYPSTEVLAAGIRPCDSSKGQPRDLIRRRHSAAPVGKCQASTLLTAALSSMPTCIGCALAHTKGLGSDPSVRISVEDSKRDDDPVGGSGGSQRPRKPRRH